MEGYVHSMSILGVHVSDTKDGGMVIHNRVELSVVAEVKEK